MPLGRTLISARLIPATGLTIVEILQIDGSHCTLSRWVPLREVAGSGRRSMLTWWREPVAGRRESSGSRGWSHLLGREELPLDRVSHLGRSWGTSEEILVLSSDHIPPLPWQPPLKKVFDGFCWVYPEDVHEDKENDQDENHKDDEVAS